MLQSVILRNLSCSGGTFLASVLSANRSVYLLNEFHPLETTPGAFTPNSFIGNFLNHNTYNDLDIVLNSRIEQVKNLGKNLDLTQGSLLIRWHSYFDFLTPYFFAPARSTNFQKFSSLTNSRVFTVIRDPLSSYISNVVEGFISMSLNEYVARYETFIAESEKTFLFRYEDLVTDSKALAGLSERMFGSWSKEQLDSTNWKAISGTKHLRKDSNAKVENVSILDAVKILEKFDFCNIKDGVDNLNRVSEIAGYNRAASENYSYVGKMLGRLVQPVDELTQQRDELTQQRDELTQQRDELTQQRDELTQQRDELTQQRDELTQQRDELTQQRDEILNSTMWRATKPIRWFVNLIKR
jgi:hypothetical protein